MVVIWRPWGIPLGDTLGRDSRHKSAQSTNTDQHGPHEAARHSQHTRGVKQRRGGGAWGGRRKEDRDVEGVTGMWKKLVKSYVEKRRG